nr:anhydro-N-acetylmuramic acid kinase [Sphingomonas quercus]
MGSVLAVGLMSGTSLDGIDAALIETDGEGAVRPVAFLTEPYPDEERAAIREATAMALSFSRPRHDLVIDAAAAMLTDRHMDLVRRLLAHAGVEASGVAVIGFHGQTIAHRPDRGWTWQIGEGDRMAKMLGIPVVDDFRSADVIAGGQGAPLIPVYHRALTADGAPPLAVLNLGGVGNVTFIGADGALIAFDTGPANALIDDWVLAETGARYDAGGALAAAGRVDEAVLATMLDNGWFDRPPPKSLDRADFGLAAVRGLSAADGAATLTAFTAETIARAFRHCPEQPRRLIVAGGGRHNATLMEMIARRCNVAAEPIEALGWNGDATEAEGFAYMAVRTLKGLEISFPGTTGVRRPMPGGVLHRP